MMALFATCWNLPPAAPPGTALAQDEEAEEEATASEDGMEPAAEGEEVRIPLLPNAEDSNQPPAISEGETRPAAPGSVENGFEPTSETVAVPPLVAPESQDAGQHPQERRIGDALQELLELNPVVATVNGEEIRWAEVIESAEDLPLENEDQVESLFPALLDRLVDLKLLTAAARAEDLASDERIRAQVRRYEENLIRERYLRDYLEQTVDERSLRERYDILVATIGSSQQVHARHILVATEEEAAALIGALDGGADFGLLARKYSKGPSAARGGDLGYFDPARMVPEFSEAALRLEIGSYTAEPVRSPFGWHVIELLDHTVEGVPPFAEMRPALDEQLTQEALQTLLQRLRGESEIALFPEQSEIAPSPPATTNQESTAPAEVPEPNLRAGSPGGATATTAIGDEPEDNSGKAESVGSDPSSVSNADANPVPLFAPREGELPNQSWSE